MADPKVAMDGNPGALTGIRVLDLGLLVQAPQAAQLLGDLGAEVIKVELPGLGDQARWIPISLEDLRAPFFIGCNRGKRSLTLDLRKDPGRDVFLSLADTADVIVSNFLPGTLDRWGLGYDVLSARNAGLIYATGSTFGALGPDADRKGADIAGQAAGGLIARTPSAHRTPVGAVIADHIGSQNMANGVLAALFARERTGRGQQVEVSLYGGQIYAQASEYTFTCLTGENPGEVDGGHQGIPLVYGIVPTADGHLAIVGVASHERENFFNAIGRPDLLADKRFESLVLAPDVRHELFEELGKTFRTRPTAEWEATLRSLGQRYARVQDYTDVMGDEGAYANGYLQRVEHPEWGEIPMVGSPIRLSDTPARPGQIAPELGQHTEEILLELGLSWDTIVSLREEGVI